MYRIDGFQSGFTEHIAMVSLSRLGGATYDAKCKPGCSLSCTNMLRSLTKVHGARRGCAMPES
jgi:hypothetical protein